MSEVILRYNEGFSWNSENGIYVKGYIYLEDEVYICKSLISVFENITSYEEFKEAIRVMNGNFSVVIKRKNETWISVDRARSIPLFYSEDGRYISDCVETIIDNMNCVEFDNISISEQILSSFIYGSNTAIKGIKQLQLGECARIVDNKIETNIYYRHFSDKRLKQESELLNEFNVVTNSIFNKLIKSLNGRRVIIPLSGGYDSRYIAAMLKKLNYDNVVCYTYGDENQYEVKYSKIIAEQLGYEWHFIKYTDSEWNKIINETFYSYCDYCHNYSSVPHIQDFIALKSLKDKGIIKNDDIIVNGFCGDLPAGSFVKSKEDEKYLSYNKSSITDYILKENYNHIPIKEHQKLQIHKRINQEINMIDIEVDSFDNFTTVYESWFTGARPSKWVVNSNRVYEFFGMEWRMPLWDNEFLEFWYSVPNDLRRSTYLYQKYLFETLFTPMNIDMKKPSFTNSLSITEKKSLKRLIKLKVLHFITIIQLYFGVTIYKRNDVNNYAALSRVLTRKIKNKKCLNHKNIYAHQVMAFWWCERIYGYENIKQIFKESR